MLYYYIVYYIIFYFIMLYSYTIYHSILWHIVLLYYDKLCSIMIYEHYRYGIDTQISATMVLIHVSEWDAHKNLRLKLVIPENICLRICWSGVILWILISSTSMGMHVHQHSPTVILFIELYLWSSPFIGSFPPGDRMVPSKWPVSSRHSTRRHGFHGLETMDRRDVFFHIWGLCLSNLKGRFKQNQVCHVWIPSIRSPFRTPPGEPWGQRNLGKNLWTQRFPIVFHGFFLNSMEMGILKWRIHIQFHPTPSPFNMVKLDFSLLPGALSLDFFEPWSWRGTAGLGSRCDFFCNSHLFVKKNMPLLSPSSAAKSHVTK